MDPSTTAAPAQPAEQTPATPATVSASRAAVDAGDFAAFQESERAKREGRAKPDVAAPAAKPSKPGETSTTAAPKPGETSTDRPVSNRQQRANDAIREAVDRATADLRAENEQLRRQAGGQGTKPADAPASETRTPPAAETKAPDYKRFAAMPDAPKLAEFEGPNGFEEYIAAMSVFMADKRHEAREVEARTRTERESHEQILTAQEQKFQERIASAKAANAHLKDTIPPAFHDPNLVPAFEVPAGQPITFANVALEVAFFSDDPVAFLQHLHAHQDEVTTIASQSPRFWKDHLTRLDGRLTASAREGDGEDARSGAAPARSVATATDAASARARDAQPSTISSAPPPPPVHRRAPASAADTSRDAVNRDDFGAFQRHERQKREQRMRGA